MKYLFGLLLMGICINANAQVIYDENVEVRNVASFNAIEVSGTVTVYLTQANTTAIAVSAGDEKYNEKIKTAVNDGVLKISVDGGVWNTFSLADRKLKAYVSVSALHRLQVSGASNVMISGTLTSTALRLQLSGASEIKGDVDLEKLSLTITGASVVRLSGKVEEGLVEASGASKINSYDLEFDKLKAQASGASAVRIAVKASLAADASGGSTIYYKGSPSQTMINASAGASIRQRASKE